MAALQTVHEETQTDEHRSPQSLGKPGVQAENSRRLMSQQGLTILDLDPLSAPTTCLSTSDIEDRSPATPSTDLYSESFMTS
jgi:hypothetical protein